MESSSLMWILSSYGETIIVWDWIQFCSGVCLWANNWFLYPSQICLINLVWKKIGFALYEDNNVEGRKSLLKWGSDLINRTHSVFNIWWSDNCSNTMHNWEKGENWMCSCSSKTHTTLPLSRINEGQMGAGRNIMMNPPWSC